MHWEQYPEYQNLWKAHPSYWVIDRELDVFIWSVKGRMPEWPNEIFGLYWKGNGDSRIEVIRTLKVSPGTDEKLCDVFWDVMRIKLPESLELERGQIENALKNALEAFSKRVGGIGDVRVSIRKSINKLVY
ncbi:hypothetical protein RHM58_15965 [Pseudomonas sp. 10S4]|uniref:hypothetical protein n=1 Tax=Pseudomonas sp. 10S4 TaxID=3048583 RepID=UPI002AC96BEF|nr:hypothetical protein [Pseudomonas sp. 10S4]WPX21212.1 hypothetical protein RHM58_15965 [Pseudomonas sp. 10S4]